MRFNALSETAAEAELLTCCASRRFASAVAAGRPCASAAELRERLGDDPETERSVAHGELVRIIELRMRTLFS